jgi:cell division protein FtsB
MPFLAEIRRRARHALHPLAAVCVFGYFAYHAIEGDRGGLAWMRLKAEIAHTAVERDTVAAERRAWENRVSQLRPESLDPDMLEERARLLLNVVGRNDILVLVPDGAVAYRPATRSVAQR